MKTEDLIERLGEVAGEVPPDSGPANGGADQEQEYRLPAVAAAGLPELLINDSDPTATAKLLAKLIAEGTTFLFNGHGLIRVVVEADGMPRAIEVNTEMIRVLAHEICRPVKLTKVKKDGGKIVWENRDVSPTRFKDVWR